MLYWQAFPWLVTMSSNSVLTFQSAVSLSSDCYFLIASFSLDSLVTLAKSRLSSSCIFSERA